jgi:RecQ-mediated genome instability protein 1
MSAPPLANELTAHLVSKGLNVTPAWVNGFLASQRTSVPLPALKQTALFRIIQTDITSSLQRPESSLLPTNIHDANVRERKLSGPIPVQVLDIEDIGRSRWSQAELIESEERGETTRGREIIRVVPGEDASSAEPAQVQTVGPHKLLLQDAQGTQVYSIELSAVSGITLAMSIGAKLVLREVTVSRGVLLLEARSVSILGGKLDELHKTWKGKRKENLKSGAIVASQQLDGS